MDWKLLIFFFCINLIKLVYGDELDHGWNNRRNNSFVIPINDAEHFREIRPDIIVETEDATSYIKSDNHKHLKMGASNESCDNSDVKKLNFIFNLVPKIKINFLFFRLD
jgi:hypothetical protein